MTDAAQRDSNARTEWTLAIRGGGGGGGGGNIAL